MKTLTTLLERISASLGRDTTTKEGVLECVKDIVGFNLTSNDIYIANGVLEITTSPAKKSTIKLEEDRILREIKERCNVSITRIFYK